MVNDGDDEDREYVLEDDGDGDRRDDDGYDGDDDNMKIIMMIKII